MSHLVEVQDIVAGRHNDPFSILGLHKFQDDYVIRVFIPDADKVDVVDDKTGYKIVGLKKITNIKGVEGFFESVVPRRKNHFAYRLNIKQGELTWISDDPYRFSAVMNAQDATAIGNGTYKNLWQVLGAHTITHEGVWGTHFAVWAPNAKRVSVVGNFNIWDGRRHVMRKCGQSGVWEIFIPRISEGEFYKFEILDKNWKLLPLKADPMGFGAEHPPELASIIRDLEPHKWVDQAWMNKRESLQKSDQPISIYEVNIGSWQRKLNDYGRRLSYTELAKNLVDYVKDMGFTHVELMPISEFPFNDSWGYLPVGLFAPTSRHGTLDEFRTLVQACHVANIGVILDWAPNQFPNDAHGLNQFDGSNLYGAKDRPSDSHGKDQGKVQSQKFNFGRKQVANYLTSNAIYWAKEFHIDALRIDDLSSIISLQKVQKNNKWSLKSNADNKDTAAIDFLKQLNTSLHSSVGDMLMIAEQATDCENVSKPVEQGGLGFNLQWNINWTNDTLQYMSEAPIHRKFHHHKMTSSVQQALSHNQILPLSHHNVAQGQGSLLEKMPGDDGKKFANLRAYYAFMWGYPGKKLMFMGNEFAQPSEWNHNEGLNWHLLDHEPHKAMQSLVRDLNKLYTTTPALYQQDSKTGGLTWVEENCAEESIFVWLRNGKNSTTPVLIISNFSTVEQTNRRIGVPKSGLWVEMLNTDAAKYGGNCHNITADIQSENIETPGFANSISLTIAPLSTVFLRPQS